MDRLPDELCDLICSTVDSNASLIALSLQSRQWAATTRRWLFRTIHVLPWLDAIRRLVEQLQHPLFRRYAECLELHLPEHGMLQGFQDYMKAIRNEGSELEFLNSWNTKANPEERLTEQETIARERPCLHEGQPEYTGEPSIPKGWEPLWHAYKAEGVAMGAAIAKLEICELWKLMFSLLGGPGDRLKQIVVDTEPVWYGYAPAWTKLEASSFSTKSHSVKRFKFSIIMALIASGIIDGATKLQFRNMVPFFITCISVRDYGNYIWSDPVRGEYVPHSPWSETLGNMTTFQLELMMSDEDFANMWPDSSDTTREKAEYRVDLWMTPKLRELIVRRDTSSGQRAHLHITPSTFWPRSSVLQRLVLSGLSNTFKHLDTLLGRTVDTLVQLELSDMQFIMQHDGSSDYEARAVLFLSFLQCHRLCYAKFQGHFSIDGKDCKLDAKLPGGIVPFETRRANQNFTIGQQLAQAVVRSGHHATRHERESWIRSLFESANAA